MVRVTTFKMPFKTRHFNANQRVWVVAFTGQAAAAYCVGRVRGKAATSRGCNDERAPAPPKGGSGSTADRSRVY